MATIDAHIEADVLIERQDIRRPLRVLMLHRDLPYDGGVPRCFLSFAENNQGQRVKLTVASFETPAPEMSSAFGDLGVPTACLSDAGYLRPARRLRRLVRDDGIELVLATSFKSYIVAKLAVAGTGVPVVFWLHSARNVIMNGWRRIVFRFLSVDDRLICVSRAVRESHRHYSHQGGVSVVYNGVQDPTTSVSLQPYKRSMRAALGLPEDAWVIGYTASFVPWKDHETLLEAFAQLDHQTTGAHLVLIGTGELEPALKRRAAELECGHLIHFLGPRPDARRLLGVVDAYVHTCREEGFGLALVEAMLAEKPVLAPHNGAPVEYITHGRNGLLFEPGDAKDLADKMTEMAANREHAAVMAARARMLCLEKFAPRKFYESLCEVIEQVAQEERVMASDFEPEFARHA